MKRALLTAALIAVATCLTAQTTQRRGFALGADKDTMLYIIASPFDNWFLELGGGIQTYIGNEQYASARKNKLNYNLHLEVGKWIIPDISVSMRLGYATMDGQSTYGRQPFLGLYEERAANANDNGYTPFSANVATLLGVVTFDWTNFLLGYEKGKHTRTHVYMPLGMGAAMLFGKQTSNSPSLAVDGYNVGDFRRNFELAFTAGLGIAYEATPNLAINLSVEAMGARQSLDWSPMGENRQGIIDWMPSVNLGMRFNLFSEVTKYNPYTKQSRKEKVNHEFLTLGSEHQTTSLKGRIQTLNARIDSIQSLADSQKRRADSEKRRADSLLLQVLNTELLMLDSAQAALIANNPPENVFDALLQANQSLDLPFTIIYFDLNKHDIRPDSYKRLENFAKHAVALGDTAEFFVIGAADAETGNPKINLRLSQLRCKETANVLVRRLGIDATQLVNVPMGGVYGSGEKNRMAMIILKVPGTQSIIDHWSRSVKR